MVEERCNFIERIDSTREERSWSRVQEVRYIEPQDVSTSTQRAAIVTEELQ